MKKVTSSLKIGVLRSRKSEASSTITGSSVSSSISWRVLGEKGGGDRGRGEGGKRGKLEKEIGKRERESKGQEKVID